MIDRVFESTGLLEKSLDATWLRNQAISHNIANVDTPGYKKKEVSFEEALDNALLGTGFSGKRTRDKHIRIGRGTLDEVIPEVRDVNPTKIRVDENNVDVETEMTELAYNTIKHHALVQKLNGEFNRLKTIINEGRK